MTAMSEIRLTCKCGHEEAAAAGVDWQTLICLKCTRMGCWTADPFDATLAYNAKQQDHLLYDNTTRLRDFCDGPQTTGHAGPISGGNVEEVEMSDPRTPDEILAPYLDHHYGPVRDRKNPDDRPTLADRLQYVDDELRVIPWDSLHKAKKAQVKAADLILQYFARLVEVNGDVRLAGPTPRMIPDDYYGFLFGWLGRRKGGPALSESYDAIQLQGSSIVIYPYADDGSRFPFFAVAMGEPDDGRAIAQGVSDLTGETQGWWKVRVNEAGAEYFAPCWNREEMDKAYGPSGTADRELGKQRNRDYQGRYRSHWSVWRDKDFQDACLETHTEADFDGLPRNRVPYLTR